jgi:hypothetical protein
VGRLSNGSCVANVELEADRWSTEYGSDVIVWKDETLLIGAQYDFGRRVDNEVEDLTKEFIAAWLKTNPR